MAPVIATTAEPGLSSPLRVSGPLTLARRILAINLLSVLLVGAGFLWLDSYRNQLVERRVREVATTADVARAALDAGGAGGLLPLARASDSRLRLYAPDGALSVDSWRLAAPNFVIAAEPEDSWRKRAAARLDELVDRTVFARPPRRFAEPAIDRASAWPELNGKTGESLRVAPDRTAVITVGRRLMDGSSLLMTVNARDLRRDVRAERLRLALAVLMALLVTALLSAFLARTVVRPIRRLAVAARQVRLGRRRDVVVPRMADRGDEIGVLARSVADMTHALRARADSIEEFAADVSHELKNPLASLLSAAESLGRVEDPALQRQLTAIIADDARRMDRLVSDIAEASRLDARLARSGFAPVDLSATISAVLARQADRAAERRVRVAFARPQIGTVVVAGLDAQLARALDNLIANALSFSPPGGLVEIRARTDGDRVEVTVEDEGPGVPIDAREAVFRRFHSDRPSDQAGQRHSGLGLAIARAIAEGHDGTLCVDDRADGRSGARFVLCLPLIEPEG